MLYCVVCINQNTIKKEVQAMRFIAHRGNMFGPNPSDENRVKYILYAMNMGYDVEIDIWYKNNDFYTGHDEPLEKIGLNILTSPKAWCHAKNIDALYWLMNYDDINCFMHDRDEATITSHGYIWTLPGRKLTRDSVCVSLGDEVDTTLKCYGVCSDYAQNWKLKYSANNP